MAFRSTPDAAPSSRLNSRLGTWLKVLAALLAVALIALIVATIVDKGGDDSQSVSEQQSAPKGPPATRRQSLGALTAAGRSLLPVPKGGFGPSVGEQVSGTGVSVQSAAGQNGFWIGVSESQRVFVATTAKAPEVRTGDRLDVRGTVKAAPSDPAKTLDLTTTDAGEVKLIGGYVRASDVSRAK
jgi:hypothetical protein